MKAATLSSALVACVLAHGALAQDVAKQLANPIASLVSVPFQLNYDDGYGADGPDGGPEGWGFRINVVLVYPR